MLHKILATSLVVLSLTSTTASAGKVTFCIGNNCNKQQQSQQTSQRLTAKGYEALEDITRGNEVTSGVGNNGWSYFVVNYQGKKYPQAVGRIFSCKASPDAVHFECVSWPEVR